MYAACVNAVGGRLVPVPPRDDLSFPGDEILDGHHAAHAPGVPHAARTTRRAWPSRTRDIERVLARLPAGALLFLDEAYVDFAPRLRSSTVLAGFPNVVVGRTFAKAYGLAALRIGCVVAQPETLSVLRRTSRRTA